MAAAISRTVRAVALCDCWRRDYSSRWVGRRPPVSGTIAVRRQAGQSTRHTRFASPPPRDWLTCSSVPHSRHVGRSVEVLSISRICSTSLGENGSGVSGTLISCAVVPAVTMVRGLRQLGLALCPARLVAGNDGRATARDTLHVPHGGQCTAALRPNHPELAATSGADRGFFRSADYFPDQPDFFTGERDGSDGIAGCHTNEIIHRSAAGSFLRSATVAAEPAGLPVCGAGMSDPARSLTTKSLPGSRNALRTAVPLVIGNCTWCLSHLVGLNLSVAVAEIDHGPQSSSGSTTALAIR